MMERLTLHDLLYYSCAIVTILSGNTDFSIYDVNDEGTELNTNEMMEEFRNHPAYKIACGKAQTGNLYRLILAYTKRGETILIVTNLFELGIDVRVTNKQNENNPDDEYSRIRILTTNLISRIHAYNYRVTDDIEEGDPINFAYHTQYI